MRMVGIGTVWVSNAQPPVADAFGASTHTTSRCESAFSSRKITSGSGEMASAAMAGVTGSAMSLLRERSVWVPAESEKSSQSMLTLAAPVAVRKLTLVGAKSAWLT
eukprot:4804568-Prymnesium_polylepis.1